MGDVVTSIVCLVLFAAGIFFVLWRRMRVGRLHALPSRPPREYRRSRAADDGDGDGDAGDEDGDGGDA